MYASASATESPTNVTWMRLVAAALQARTQAAAAPASPVTHKRRRIACKGYAKPLLERIFALQSLRKQVYTSCAGNFSTCALR
jgi:hypothetical protein